MKRIRCRTRDMSVPHRPLVDLSCNRSRIVLLARGVVWSEMSGRRLATALLVVLTACSGGGGSVPVHRVPIASDVYFGLTWLPDGWLVVTKDVGFLGELWRVRPDGSGFAQIHPPSDSRCRRIDFLHPEALPNGRLGYLRVCDFKGTQDRNELALMSYDMGTGAQRAMMAKPLGFNSGAYTWNPGMTKGLFSVSSGLCAGIGAMTRQSVVDLPLTVEAAPGRFYLVQEDVFALGSADCSNEILADLPAWSPDGTRIAFLASPGAIGRGGFSRPDAPWNLYLVGPAEVNPVVKLQGLLQPHDLAWSPDSRWLALSGKVNGRDDGLWLYELGSGRLRQVASGVFDVIAWSPNGSQIAVLHQFPGSGADLPKSEILVLDVG